LSGFQEIQDDHALHLVSWQLCRGARKLACLSHHKRSIHLLTVKRSTRVDECQRLQFVPHGEIQWHLCYVALQCQTPFCQTAPLLLSLARQKKQTNYWREGWTSTVINQHQPLTSWANIIKLEALLSECPS
jgi:hypothetical protein